MKKIPTFLLLVCGFFFLFHTPAFANPLQTYVNASWNGIPEGADPDGSGPALAMGIDSFTTINAAIEQVETGGVVYISAGIYQEQLIINRNLSLIGSGPTTILESPTLLSSAFNTGVPNKPIIWAHDAADIRIQSLVVDGLGLGNSNYRFMGIAYWNAGGVVDSVEIRNIEETPLSGNQHGIGIYVRNPGSTDRHITISHCNVHDYQKNGMAIIGGVSSPSGAMNATITDNTVIGSGPTPQIAQNGIQLSYGAIGVIERNLISGNSCTSEAGNCTLDPAVSLDADTAAGILVFSPGHEALGSIGIANNILQDNQCQICALSYSSLTNAPTMTLNIQQNNIDGGFLGIAVFDPDGTVTVSGDISNNLLTHQSYGLFVRDDDSTTSNLSINASHNRIENSLAYGAWSNTIVQAENNWWGCSTGSLLTAGSCTAHTALVDVDPWFTTPDGSAAGGSSGTAGTAGSGGFSVSSDEAVMSRYTGALANSSGAWFNSSLTIDGILRNVRVYRPNSSPNLPLVIIYSGTGALPVSNFIEQLSGYSGEETIADRFNSQEPAILLFPEERDIDHGDWDRLYGAPYWETQSVDSLGNVISDDPSINPDLVFTRALIQESRLRYQINPERVYTMGFSSGAFFSTLAAFSLNDRVAAFSEQSGGWVQCPRKNEWIPSSHSTSWQTLLNEGNSSISNFTSCAAGQAEPVSILPTRDIPAYFRHGNADNIVSVYYTAALANLMSDHGRRSVTTYVDGMESTALYADSSVNLVIEVLDGVGHDVGPNFITRSWAFLRQKSLTGISTGGAGVSGSAAGVSGSSAGVSGSAAGVSGSSAGVSGSAAGVSGASAGVSGSFAGSGGGGVSGSAGSGSFISRGLPVPAQDTGIVYTGNFPNGVGNVGWMTPILNVRQAGGVSLAARNLNGDTLRIYRPTSRRSQLPLVLIFPGTGGDTANFIDEIGVNPDILAAAFKDEFNVTEDVVIAVLPHANQPSGDWDHPWDAFYWNTTTDDINRNPDLAYVRAVIQEARNAYDIDPTRVYALGHSSGGFFAEYVSQMLGDRIAGFGENAGGLVGCLTDRGNGLKKAPDPQYTSTSTSCDTILSGISSSAQASYYTCSTAWEPFPQFFTGNPIPAYISHANNDNSVSVYHSCFLRQQMMLRGSQEGVNLWTSIRTTGGHSVGLGFVQATWSHLRNHRL